MYRNRLLFRTQFYVLFLAIVAVLCQPKSLRFLVNTSKGFEEYYYHHHHQNNFKPISTKEEEEEAGDRFVYI